MTRFAFLLEQLGQAHLTFLPTLSVKWQYQHEAIQHFSLMIACYEHNMQILNNANFMSNHLIAYTPLPIVHKEPNYPDALVYFVKDAADLPAIQSNSIPIQCKFKVTPFETQTFEQRDKYFTKLLARYSQHTSILNIGTDQWDLIKHSKSMNWNGIYKNNPEYPKVIITDFADLSAPSTPEFEAFCIKMLEDFKAHPEWFSNSTLVDNYATDFYNFKKGNNPLLTEIVKGLQINHDFIKSTYINEGKIIC